MLYCYNFEVTTPEKRDDCNFGQKKLGKMHLGCDGTGEGHHWRSEGNTNAVQYCPRCGNWLGFNPATDKLERRGNE